MNYKELRAEKAIKRNPIVRKKLEELTAAKGELEKKNNELTAELEKAKSHIAAMAARIEFLETPKTENQKAKKTK